MTCASMRTMETPAVKVAGSGFGCVDAGGGCVDAGGGWEGVGGCWDGVGCGVGAGGN